MNKDQLQQELKEKIKAGIKPSDLKKKTGNINSQIPTPPDSPIITPIDKKPSKKQGQEGNSPSPIVCNKKIKELEQSVKFWEKTASNYLSSLQKLTAENDSLKLDNKETETALKEANQKIRELQEKVNRLYGGNDKEKIKELFTCYHCQKEQQISLLVLELPEGKLCQPCWAILRKKTKEQVKVKQKFTCHNCREIKEGKEYKVKLDPSEQLYSICSLCLPTIKEYNEKEADSNRELDIWE